MYYSLLFALRALKNLVFLIAVFVRTKVVFEKIIVRLTVFTKEFSRQQFTKSSSQPKSNPNLDFNVKKWQDGSC